MSPAVRLLLSPRIVRVRLTTRMHMDSSNKKHNDNWTKRWKSWVKPTRFPGVWKRREGGHLVRARVSDPLTGRLKDIRRVLPDASEMSALQWLEGERERIRSGVVKSQQPSVHFGDFAVELFEKKKGPGGKIKSGAGRTRWKSTLEHLIAGTRGEKAGKHVRGFGEMYIDKVQPDHIEVWRTGIAELIDAGDFAPTTANGWLSILRVIFKAAKRQLRLDHLATEYIENFDESEHATYTEEEPNALPAKRVGEFLNALRDLYPQHYAMTYLGFITGLRPSSLRPLRRQGQFADVVWDKHRILVRRSQTVGDEVMNTTKQKRRYAIDLPEDAIQVLQWHVETQLTTPEQQASELLFPSVTGGFRAPTVLNKPFADAAHAIDLGFTFTQRGMRRTFNDLARHAKIEALVTRSISGHLTERMQHHYSTVASQEQRESIAKVIDLFAAKGSATPIESTSSGTPRVHGGEPSGDPTLEVGSQNKKAG